MKRKNQAGFTIIELLVVVLVVSVLTLVGVSNIRSVRAERRDEARKTDVNAMYFQLEAFFEKNSYYPEKLDATTLAGIDPSSLKDTKGSTIGDPASEYTYTPENCSESKCKGYELSSTLEREATYAKQSLNN